MLSPYRALDQYSRSQLARGLVLLLFGIVAISWPETAMSVSMIVAGALVALSGVYDVLVGTRARRSLRAWPALVGHGVASVAFGALTVGLPYAPPAAAMTLVAFWLVLYGSMTGALALALWPMRRTRWTLVGVTVAVIPLGMSVTLLADVPRFVPLYLGAFFAVFLGALHLAGGLWLRRVALPHFAPTSQAAWAPASGFGLAAPNSRRAAKLAAPTH